MLLEKTKTATTLITFFRAHKRAITFSLVAFCAFWLSRGALHRSYFLPYFAVFVTLIFSQLFWIGRVLDLVQRFIPGKPGRAWLAVIAAAVWVFFFRAYNFNPRHLPYDPRLRQMLIDGAFSVWVVGSWLGFGLVMAFWAVEALNAASMADHAFALLLDHDTEAEALFAGSDHFLERVRLQEFDSEQRR